MFNYIFKFSIFVFLSVTVLLISGCGQDSGKIGKQKLCTECHGDYVKEQTSEEGFVPHKPFINGQCRACHMPHGIFGSLQLQGTVLTICTSCHEGFDASTNVDENMKIHKPVSEGGCLICHNSHGSPVKGLLNADEAKICYSCHNKNEFADKKTVHKAIELSCSSCHSPHKSDKPTLLKSEAANLCAKCHDYSKSSIKSSHNKIEFSTSDCFSCHEPHSTDKNKLMRKVEHKPFADRNCASCHDLLVNSKDDEQGSNGLKDDFCFSCHSDFMSKIEQLKFSHGGDFNKQCITCHDVHASDNNYLLKDNEKSLCMTCHDNYQSELNKVFVHTPVKENTCSGCHSAHGSQIKNFLKFDTKEICVTCHDTVEKAVKNSHKPAADQDCMVCHSPHSSDEKGILLDSQEEICYSCHKGEKIKHSQVFVHAMVKQGKCNSCHNAHGSDNESILIDSDKKIICLTCHKIDIGKQKGSHKVVEEAKCLECHNAHSSNYDKQLKEPESTLCLTCHSSIEKGLNKKSNVHDPFKQGECSKCHNAHGTSVENSLRGSLSGVCLQCHEKLRSDIKEPGAVVHDPVITGRCDKCHSPHFSDNDNLLTKKANNLCLECHAGTESKLFVEKHGGPSIAKGELNCIGCHNAHLGKDEKFIHENQHKPFEEGKCSACHN